MSIRAGLTPVILGGRDIPRPQMVVQGQGNKFDPTIVSGLKVDADFTDPAVLFTDVGRTTLVSADGQTIKGITDKSGQANHLSDATGCTYKAAIVNGYGVGRFVLAGTTKLVSPVFGVALAQPNTVFIVVAETVRTGFPTFVAGPAGHDEEIYMANAAGNKWSCFAGTPVETGLDSTSSWTIVCVTFNGAATNMWVNGAPTQVNVNAGAQDLTQLTIGAKAAGTFGMTGDTGRVLLYNANLATADRDYVKNGLGAQFGIAVV